VWHCSPGHIQNCCEVLLLGSCLPSLVVGLGQRSMNLVPWSPLLLASSRGCAAAQCSSSCLMFAAVCNFYVAAHVCCFACCCCCWLQV
jgi:hypothetical protein